MRTTSNSIPPPRVTAWSLVCSSFTLIGTTVVGTSPSVGTTSAELKAPRSRTDWRAASIFSVVYGSPSLMSIARRMRAIVQVCPCPVTVTLPKTAFSPG